MTEEKVGTLYICGEKYSLSNKPYRIGKAAFCDLQHTHPSLSHYHARIDWVTVGFLILDLDSQHKTIVNGEVLKKYTPAIVSHLAIVKFGVLKGLLMVDNKFRLAIERKLSLTFDKKLQRRIEYKIPKPKSKRTADWKDKFLRCDIVATLNPKRRYSEFNESALNVVMEKIEIS